MPTVRNYESEKALMPAKSVQGMNACSIELY
jgi:hypothetical protein